MAALEYKCSYYGAGGIISYSYPYKQ